FPHGAAGLGHLAHRAHEHRGFPQRRHVHRRGGVHGASVRVPCVARRGLLPGRVQELLRHVRLGHGTHGIIATAAATAAATASWQGIPGARR
ncbi:unnamed protein product, partial [Lampetra planeri]